MNAKLNIKIKSLLKLFFIVLILGLILFFDRFAKISINIISIPIYITESFIVVLVSLMLFSLIIKGKIKYNSYPLDFYYFIFFLIFLISLIRGLFFYEDKIFVLRQSAIFYYSIFYYLTPLLFNSWNSLKNFFNMLFVIYLILPIIMLLGFANEKLGFFAYFYCTIFIIFELFYMRFVTKQIRWLFWIAIIGQLAIFIFAKARAAWMGAFFAGVFVLYLVRVRMLSGKFLLKIVSNFFIIFYFLFIMILVFKPSLVEDIIIEASTVFMISLDDSSKSELSIANARWRLYVWKDIINETLEKPLLGWGFGKKFIPPTIKELGWGGSWHDPEKGFQDPHNSFLSIFHRTGFLGFGVFMLIILKFISRTLKVVKTITDERIKMLMLASLISIIYVLGVSFFMVVLEVPYLGISLWFLMGLILSLEIIYKKQTYKQIHNYTNE